MGKFSDKDFESSRQSSSHQDYADNEEGTWQIFGEDPNCDLTGHHSNPILGVVTGKFLEVLRYAVTLPNFFSWGGGGYLKKIHIMDISKTKEIEALKKQRDEYLAVAKTIERQIIDFGGKV